MTKIDTQINESTDGAATMGIETTMFFTFWGLNVLKKKMQEEVARVF